MQSLKSPPAQLHAGSALLCGCFCLRTVEAAGAPGGRRLEVERLWGPACAESHALGQFSLPFAPDKPYTRLAPEVIAVLIRINPPKRHTYTLCLLLTPCFTHRSMSSASPRRPASAPMASAGASCQPAWRASTRRATHSHCACCRCTASSRTCSRRAQPSGRPREVHCCHAYLLAVGCLLSGVSSLAPAWQSARPRRMGVAEVLEALLNQGTVEAATRPLSTFVSGIC